MLIPSGETQLIMVTYFRPNDLRRCLESIVTNTVGPFRLSIIDNSCGGLEDVFNEINDERVVIYRNESNLGKGKGFMRWYNQIMNQHDSEFFVSIDPDLVVPRNWLPKILRAAYTIPNPGVLAPVLTWKEGDTFDRQKASGKLVMHKDGPESGFVMPFVYKNRHTAGPLFLIHRKFFEQIGGYVQTQLYGNDDGELCKAAHRKNRFIGIVTDVEVLHLNNDATVEYKEWKKRNVNKDVDGRGFWD